MLEVWPGARTSRCLTDPPLLTSLDPIGTAAHLPGWLLTCMLGIAGAVLHTHAHPFYWLETLDHVAVRVERIRAIAARLSTRLQARQDVPTCTAPLGLVESLPADLLPHLLASGLSADDLAHCAATCTTLAGIVMRDASSDELLWRPICRARWATKAYDPLSVHPEVRHLPSVSPPT